jgi:hypothetical protein
MFLFHILLLVVHNVLLSFCQRFLQAVKVYKSYQLTNTGYDMKWFIEFKIYSTSYNSYIRKSIRDWMNTLEEIIEKLSFYYIVMKCLQ